MKQVKHRNSASKILLLIVLLQQKPLLEVMQQKEKHYLTLFVQHVIKDIKR